jgi:hypothetical protein
MTYIMKGLSVPQAQFNILKLVDLPKAFVHPESAALVMREHPLATLIATDKRFSICGLPSTEVG